MIETLKVFNYIEDFNGNENLSVIVIKKTTSHFGFFEKTKKLYYLYVKEDGEGKTKTNSMYILNDEKEIERKCAIPEYNEIVEMTNEFFVTRKLLKYNG